MQTVCTMYNSPRTVGASEVLLLLVQSSPYWASNLHLVLHSKRFVLLLTASMLCLLFLLLPNVHLAVCS
jgi:hypothetical protein